MHRPVSSGKVFPSITANGREEERRLLCIKYCTPQEKVLKEMEDDLCNLQPESEGFILVEFCSGAHATVSMCIILECFNCGCTLQVEQHTSRLRWTIELRLKSKTLNSL